MSDPHHPKEGDKRHGAHGMEVFHNGHWVAMPNDHAKETEAHKEHH